MFNKENEIILFLKIFEEKTLYLHLLKKVSTSFLLKISPNLNFTILTPIVHLLPGSIIFEWCS